MRQRNEIGGYSIVKRIGFGGMSSVYEAIDAGGARVALKLLHPAIAADPSSRERLCREVAMLRRINGPYVAQVVDAEIDDDDIFIVTELVDGPTLEADVREQGAYSGEDLVELGEELADALDSIHEAGVLHRDLKPSNVMIGPEGPVLIDFGIAQTGDDTRLTQTGSLAHTPGYCDPRVLRGASPDAQADWWAMAAVLAYAATGRPPFGKGSAPVVMHRVLSLPPDLAGIDEPLRLAFSAALDPDSNRRLSFDELLSVVRDLANASLIGLRSDNYDAGGALPATVLPSFVPDEDATQVTQLVLGTDLESHDDFAGDNEFVGNDDATVVVSDENLGEDDHDFGRTEMFGVGSEPGNAGETQILSQGLEFGGGDTGTMVLPDATQVMETPVEMPPSIIPNAHCSERMGRQEPTHVMPYTTVPGLNNPFQAPAEPARLPTFRVFIFLMWGATSLLAVQAPIIGLGVAVVLFIFCDAVGAVRQKVLWRRMRRGRQSGSDMSIAMLGLPFTLVAGILRSALSVALPAVGVFAYVHFILHENLQQLPKSYLLVALAAILLVAWLRPFGSQARDGARVILHLLTPSRGYWIFWVFVALAFLLSGVFIYLLLTTVQWWPLATVFF
ncbi:serine/threonine-protein kinase [Arcanobacterium ihumii]|uniref:serine/threonine-protein kinase n=1 Tax=Arcanobacterium ihumii TaxID=2138162 RepID=UPI000F543944|nr:serine/threonine-protein kinase [Arcanobacterium ihumii]